MAVLNQVDREGRTPLFIAICGVHDIIKRLVKEDMVDVNKKTYDGTSPMYEAAKHGHIKAVECLLERADIKPNDPSYMGMLQVESE